MEKKKIVVRDSYQNYTYYRTEPVGKNFHPDFKPQLTPKQMLSLGVFGGVYYGDKPKEFPADWFTSAKISPDGKQYKKINYFGINASQPLHEWRKKGWLHKDDPRGWFQWYCRYYLGRRHEDDERQIKRWFNFRRHASAVMSHCRTGDEHCRPRQRQALLHWAYDSRSF